MSIELLVSFVAAALAVALVLTRVFYERCLTAILDVVTDVRGGNSSRRLRSVAGNARLRSIQHELNALTLAFQETLIEKRRTEDARRLMVSHISHDLRTPLTSMVGYIDALIADRTLAPEEREDFLNIVRRKCAILGELIDDLFDLSRLEPQAAPLELERLDLRALAESTLLAFYGDFKLLGVEPELDLPSGPVYVRAVRRYVERILANLISNVVRHGRDATRVAFSITPGEDSVVCSLSDNGGGIEAADLPVLFDDPWTSSGPPSESRGARGLGLSIVKKLAEAMDGSVTVRSEPWRNTVFHVTLPVWRD